MTDDLRTLLPRHKSDYDHVRAVIALHYPDVAPILPDLLIWLQDANWPISGPIAQYLVSIGEPVFPLIREVLAGTDGIWKYWCIELFVRKLPRHKAETFRPDLWQLAYQPTVDDKSEEVNERALETLQWLDSDPGSDESIEKMTSGT